MILLFTDGRVAKYDTNEHYMRFRLPVLRDAPEIRWQAHDDFVIPFIPRFDLVPFIYITTVDGDRVYKERT